MRCTVDCPVRGRCPDEAHAEDCPVFRVNCRRSIDMSRHAAQARERTARRKDEEQPIPEAVYMERAEQAARSMPAWYAERYLTSRREAYGIREL